MSRSFCRKFFSLFLAASLVSAMALAQTEEEQQAAEPEINYTAEEYEAYDRAVRVENPAEREDAIVAFIKSNPESDLVQYAYGSYLELMHGYQTQGNFERVAGSAEKILGLKPDDLSILSRAAFANFQLQNHQQVVEYGEKVYAQQPEPGVAFILAVSYGELDNEAKQVHYGEIACASFEPKECYMLLPTLRSFYARKPDWNKSAEYSRKTLKAMDEAERPQHISQADWEDFANREKAIAYAILGRQSFESGLWSQAINNYQRAVRTHSKVPALNAEAYYYIGLSSWRENRIDPAMQAFARASVLRGTEHAKPSRDHLETLYRSTHNGSLAGIDEFIENTLARR
jgi:tetratricopeptide (TPR) repeat protein